MQNFKVSAYVFPLCVIQNFSVQKHL